MLGRDIVNSFDGKEAELDAGLAKRQFLINCCVTFADTRAGRVVVRKSSFFFPPLVCLASKLNSSRALTVKKVRARSVGKNR